jgi:hypothetical protein
MPLFTPSRTKWRKWYTSIEIIHSSNTTSALLFSISTNGNAPSSSAQGVRITNVGNAFMLVLPHDISPSVRSFHILQTELLQTLVCLETLRFGLDPSLLE